MLEVSPVSRFAMDTADPELAHSWIVDTYTDHTPRLSGSPEGFRMRVASLATDLFRIDDVLHTMAVEARTEPYESLFVNRLRGGSYRMTGPQHSVTRTVGDIGLMDPHGPGVTSWDTLDAEVLVLDLGAASTVAGEIGGLPADRVRFGLSVPIDAARARYWARTVDHVRHDVLADEELAAAPLARAEVFRMLAGAATLVFPNTALEARLDPGRAGPGTAAPATVRRAVEFVDAHAREDIGIADIAEAARIGPRGLQAAFRRHRGQSPLAYLRSVRMDGAHRDLVAGDPTRGATVGAIVARWGFTNPGRFSIEYRHRHGCSPSETLRR